MFFFLLFLLCVIIFFILIIFYYRVEYRPTYVFIVLLEVADWITVIITSSATKNVQTPFGYFS